jgi:hypothetical protein
MIAMLPLPIKRSKMQLLRHAKLNGTFIECMVLKQEFLISVANLRFNKFGYCRSNYLRPFVAKELCGLYLLT